MKYVFIERYQAEFSIKVMCRVLRVARSGWYDWRIRRLQPGPRKQFRRQCDKVVSQAFHQAKQRYGAPRMTDELREQGVKYNIKTVAASLKRPGLRAKAARKFSPVSYKPHNLPVCDALQMALWRRKRPKGIIAHSDRGGQYCSTDYQALLRQHELRAA